MHRRIALGQRRRVHPVRGRRPPVEQSGGRQHEGARAQPDDAGALLMRLAQCVERFLRRRRGDRPPGRDHDGARPGDRLQPMWCGEFQPPCGPQRALFPRAHQQSVARHAGVLAVDPEHRQRYGTLEDGAAAEQQHRDDLLAASPGEFPGRGVRRGSGVVAHPAKPPSVVAAPRLCRSCTFPLGPARVPRRKTVKIESTVLRSAGVTSSARGTLSTWQLGVKHSITKRCTREPHREVRLGSVAGPRRVCGPRVPLSVQVERGVGPHSCK